MRPRSLLASVPLVLTAALHAQQEPAPPPAEIAPAAAEQTPLLNRTEPPPIVVDVPLGDEVPLPGELDPATGVKGSGDPFFLGFVAGPYYPPADERIDPKLLSEVRARPDDGRPAPTSYAFAMLSKRITQARLAELEALGCRVLGLHPWNCVKLALPPAQIDTVAALPFVRWIGSPRAAQKVHPHLLDAAARAPAGVPLEMVVDLYESDLCDATVRELIARAEQADAGGTVTPVDDERSAAFRVHSHGWQQHALEALGVDVREYVESGSVRAFLVRAPAAAIELLVALDFVQFVEALPEARTSHDESTPLIYSDSVRYHANGGTSLAVTAGEIDSGIDYQHYDITTHMNGLGWDFSGSAGGAWTDGCPHGTHVCGTITGNGYWTAGNRGNAHGLGWGATGRFFNGKIFNGCTGSVNLANVMAVFRNGQYDGGGSFTPKPMVINNSWGSGPGGWIGSEYQCRLIDDEVFWQRQMYVFAAGNDANVSTVAQEPGAKNAFAVGSIDDYAAWWTTPGTRSSFSSQGPMGDTRWKPNVCAPGDSITSLLAGTTTGYVAYNGTSMATPHVTGVAAQMCDNYSWMRYAPERAASVLMASAVTRGGAPIVDHYNGDLNRYGAGRVDAWLANFGSSQTGWSNWAFDLGAGQGTYADFYMGPGTTRFVVCMTWHEWAASSGASQAAINDWDLYIDYEPFSGTLNSGEYTAGLSSRNNTEIRYVDNPPVGWYRWKIHPYNATTTGHFSVTVFGIAGPVYPAVDLSLSASSYCTAPWVPITVTASVYNPGYLASAAWLNTSGGAFLDGAYAYLNDGPFADLSDNVTGGRAVTLGDILSYNSRSAYFEPVWTSDGFYNFQVQAFTDNGTGDTETVYVTVDGTPPSAVPSVASTTHTAGAWDCSNIIDAQWQPASDATSGVQGYSIDWNQTPVMDPDGAVDTWGTSSSTWAADSLTPYYFHVRAIDWCGNAGPTSHAGPYYVLGAGAYTYCTGKMNSAFCTPYMTFSGRLSMTGQDDLHLWAHDVINQRFGLLFWGLTPGAFPFQGGTRCVGAPSMRTPIQDSGGSASGVDCTGVYDYHFDRAYAQFSGLAAGQIFYSQYWYRDPADPFHTGLSNATAAVVCD